jgi:hypothetical protein
MTRTMISRCPLVLAVAALSLTMAVAAHAQLAAEFHGDWVPATGNCEASQRLRVAAGLGELTHLAIVVDDQHGGTGSPLVGGFGLRGFGLRGTGFEVLSSCDRHGGRHLCTQCAKNAHRRFLGKITQTPRCLLWQNG